MKPMKRSISARLTLWYTIVLAVVLVTAGAGVYFAQGHLDRKRLSDDLQSAADTVAVSVNAEIDEGESLHQAVADQLRELVLPGRAFALYDAQGHLRGARWEGLSPRAVGSIDLGVADRMRTVHDGRHWWRILQQFHQHRGIAYRLVVAQPLHVLAHQQEELRGGLFLVIPFALLLAASGGWWLARQALRPLSAMAAQAQEISERDLGSRLSVANPRDELGTFARAFNDLLGRLDTVLQTQRQFMADASHELRTPVSAARTAAEVTLDAKTPQEADYREALEMVAGQMRRLTSMVDQMLVLARADAGTRQLDPRDFYFDELVAECARTADLLARRGVRVTWQAPADLECHGDEELLRQLILNLLDNGVRHCRDGGRVEVSVALAGDTVTLTVRDQGHGVPEADHERIFERFVRLDPARGSGGVGLGLPIARWVADAHGGSLVVARSGAEGTTFLVTLPATMFRRRVEGHRRASNA